MSDVDARVDLNICEMLGNGYRFGEGNDSSRADMTAGSVARAQGVAQNRFKWLDGQMADGRNSLRQALTLADILFHCFITFFAKVDNRSMR